MSDVIELRASNEAWKGTKKPYVALLTGLDRGRNFEREFLPRRALVIEPGLYEVQSFDKKERLERDHYVVLTDGQGNLVKCQAKETSVIEILRAGRPITDLRVCTDEDGDLSFRAADGALNWVADPRAELAAERAKLVARLAEIDAELAR